MASARSSPTRISAKRTKAFLPEAGRRRRGEIDVEEAVATAKLNDARSLDEACSWLKPKERLAVLNDRALISLLVRLCGDPGSAGPGRQWPGRRSTRLTLDAQRSPSVAIEQGEKQQTGDEPADMGDPGDRRLGGAEGLRAGAEHEIGRHPDADEYQCAPLAEQFCQARGGSVHLGAG